MEVAHARVCTLHGRKKTKEKEVGNTKNLGCSIRYTIIITITVVQDMFWNQD